MTLTGVVLVFLSAVTIAFYYVWTVEPTETYRIVTVSVRRTFAGFLMLVPFSAWEMSQASLTVEPEAVAAAAYLGMLVTVIGLFLWLWLPRTVLACVAASVQFLQSVFSIAASAALFDDRMGSLFTMFLYLPVGLDDFVDQVVPELQCRGPFRTEYESRTLRENLGFPRPANRFFPGAAG